VTEGDSAKTLAVDGLGVIGVFLLQGRNTPNIGEATTKQILDNSEVANLHKTSTFEYWFV
jgi:DNA gyrase/topoisomerase IV subunit B